MVQQRTRWRHRDSIFPPLIQIARRQLYCFKVSLLMHNNYCFGNLFNLIHHHIFCLSIIYLLLRIYWVITNKPERVKMIWLDRSRDVILYHQHYMDPCGEMKFCCNHCCLSGVAETHIIGIISHEKH